MKIWMLAAHSVDDATAKASTGRTLGEWYALLDASGGPDLGVALGTFTRRRRFASRE